ncbi:MAG: DnaD domain protein [Oscillospiraceae bacterium]|nr:DnaD domain protein [Oscillospiraceae bacterium]
MEELKLTMEESGALILERHTVDRLISNRNGDAALLYLYLLREGGHITMEKTTTVLHRSATWVKQTLEELKALGLVRQNKSSAGVLSQEPERLPSYTGEEIAKEMEGDSPFPALVQETQRRLGRTLSTADLTILFGLYDYLNLPAEVISLLVTYCAEQQKQQSGGEMTRPLRMRQVEREAYRWKRHGVDTLDQAVAHLKYLEQRRSIYGELFHVMQIENRLPSPSEQKYLDSFLDMGFPVESIALAYDKTVLQTGSLKWPYLNSILKRWHQKNLHTVEEIKAGDAPLKPTGQKTSGAPASQADDQEAIRWMKELVRRQQQEEKPK